MRTAIIQDAWVYSDSKYNQDGCGSTCPNREDDLSTLTATVQIELLLLAAKESQELISLTWSIYTLSLGEGVTSAERCKSLIMLHCRISRPSFAARLLSPEKDLDCTTSLSGHCVWPLSAINWLGF
jgi:hypothetical protein